MRKITSGKVRGSGKLWSTLRMTKRVAPSLAGLFLIAAIGGCSSSAKPAALPTTPTPSAATPSAAAASVPGAFNIAWQDSSFASSGCPAGSAKDAVCYAGSASGQLPVIGTVTLSRSVVTSGPEDANGCVNAVTDGTLTSAGGVLTFHATGNLCTNQVATYTLTSSSGTGTLAGLTVTGTITNNAGDELWAGKVTTG